MVRSELFKTHQIIGNPVVHVERMVQWDVDELIVIDISEGEETKFQHDRDDYRVPGARDLHAFINLIANECRIPLTFGGRIRTLEEARMRIINGADKITINAAALARPEFIEETAQEFGSQAVVVGVDYRSVDQSARVFTDHGRQDTGLEIRDWVKQAEDAGAGEIFLNAIERDGSAQGYDLDTIEEVVDAVRIPVIACGGAGHQRHFQQCFEQTGVSAVAAGNIFHFTENAYPRAKQFLRERRDDIR